MRFIKFSLFIPFFLFSLSFFDASFDDLPKQSKDFVNKHFKSSDIVSVVKNPNNFVLRFKDGMKLEFDITDGSFSEAEIPITNSGEVQGDGLSINLLPEPVAKALVQDFISKYPYVKIYSIDKDKKGYEINLSSRFLSVEVYYDANGKLIESEYDSEDD